ncbi:serine/threonine-protein kinase Rio1 [Natranaeroarchaeum aerophilus]|uniref:non-specific serine/threonine protein kinase n=1 Tax=Natranaeroarchaeum aerophilus TaxID=2917711 RepID=A0AAE3K5U3_9EURY|nr:serine/threonine-protein kinase Rio1 [Natranaeroarchaeum aerophilus]MCL9812084.1 serine protein kinase RIO [Natranaeroarchaeum aerophilus]
MTGEYGLLEPDESDAPGDEFEQIDVTDTEADRIARERDREFDQFRKRIKDSDRFKVDDGAFDDATFAALYKLVQDGYVDAIGGPLSTGKEANVYNALAGERSLEMLRAGEEEVAMKVYRTRATNFQDMREYLVGDPRFEELGDKKKIVMAWTRKELSNLERARKAGVRVPRPITAQRNVLIMEYIGTEDGRAKRLTEVSIENPETAFEVVREYIKRLYGAGLVHGDLSEYNVLFYDGELVVIDVGQAVTIHHPNAEEFLERDCENVASFFGRQGMEITGDELLEWVHENAEP